MTDINIGAITESLNYKSDRDLRNTDTGSGADAVVEFQVPTAENGYTWYRKYASGWVEQGGNYNRQTTGTLYLTLPVEMADVNYTAIMSCSVVNRTSDFTSNWTFAPYSTTQVQIFGLGTLYGNYSWEVKGMSAGV